MSNFSVGFRTSGSVQVLELNGELDAHTASELEAAIQKCLDAKTVCIVVNGKNLQYISSAGLGVFMAFIEELREVEGDIKIAELQDRVFNVFDLLGFPMLFNFFDSEADAVAEYQNPSGDGA